MNKELIELQRNSNVCVIVKANEYKSLSPIVSMNGNVSDSFLAGVPFAQKLDDKCKEKSLVYFVIKDIDKLSNEKQNRFAGMVKDREFNGYNLPKNCIIVFTVEDESTLKNLSNELYHLAVLAF